MRIFLLFFWYLLYTALASSAAGAQHQFSVILNFPKTLQSKEVKIFLDDGVNDNIVVDDTLVQNQLQLSRPYFSQFATVVVGSGGRFYKLWLNQKPASVRFEMDSIGLKLVQLSNAVDVDKSQPALEMNNFISVETKNIEKFMLKNNTWYTKDSLINIYQGLNKKLAAKKVEFVKKNPNTYYSFWLFRRELVYLDYNISDLISIYDNAFDTKLKSTREGSEISLRLTGRAMAKGKKSVDFTAKTINDNEIMLQDYRGKYVLITFWASWCGPCIEEFPKIKELRASYPDELLSFIFVSLDVDQKKFNSALEKYNLPGVQIRDDIELLKKYGVMAIPQVYLVDQNGYIAYSRADHPDHNLETLTKALAAGLKLNK